MRVDVPHARGINVTKLLYLKGSCWLLGTSIVPTNCVASRKTPRNRWCDVYIGFYSACLDVVKMNCYSSETKWLPYNPLSVSLFHKSISFSIVINSQK